MYNEDKYIYLLLGIAAGLIIAVMIILLTGNSVSPCCEPCGAFGEPPRANLIAVEYIDA